MKKDDTDASSPEVAAQLRALAAMSDDNVDFSDAPEVTDWSGAVRGRYSSQRKRTLSVSLDAGLVEYVEKDGTVPLDERLNILLRDWVAQARHAAE